MITRRLGESERAMVDDYMNVVPRAAVGDGECDALLWMGNAVTGKHRPTGPAWHSIWSGSRLGETAERFELFVRSVPH